jgi:putative ABC transport system substrate-binding protein
VIALLSLVLSVLAAPALAEAQPASKTWRIGFLGDGSASARVAHTLGPLREGLRELGYVEGRDFTLEVQWSEGNPERLRENAAAFVRQKVDVIVTHGLRGSRVAKEATSTIPIVVAAAADMVGSGLVASLARPGGNVTGISDQAAEVSVKEIELLAELLPNLQAVAVLWNRANATAGRAAQALQGAARDRGIRTLALEFAHGDEIERIVETASKARAGALIVVHDALTIEHRRQIAQLTMTKRLPTISAATVFAEAGGLMSYGPDLAALIKRSALFIHKVLRGAKPADLPVEQPTRFELVLNLKTAKALGITVPGTLLLRADRVIE